MSIVTVDPYTIIFVSRRLFITKPNYKTVPINMDMFKDESIIYLDTPDAHCSLIRCISNDEYVYSCGSCANIFSVEMNKAEIQEFIECVNLDSDSDSE